MNAYDYLDWGREKGRTIAKLFYLILFYFERERKSAHTQERRGKGERDFK